MGKHKAIIIGAGRIGAGFGWPEYPFCYVHADAYISLKDRVELVGFVEPNKERAEAAAAKYKLPAFENGLAAQDIDIVSVCVNPIDQPQVIAEWGKRPGIKGLWAEKPYVSDKLPIPTQVNYWRRFCKVHNTIKALLQGRQSFLTVWAKDDIHTRCHFEDLKKWWGCGGMAYFDNQGEIPQTNSYEVTTGKMTFQFKHGGIIEGGFMERALGNLLDTVEGKATLISPP